MSGLSEDEILARAGSGDKEAFATLVERYTPRVFAIARNVLGSAVDAEDVTQDVFFKVYRKLGSFEKRAAFSTWLYRVTINASTDFIKKRRQEKAASMEDMGRLPLEDPDASPETHLGRKDLRRQIRSAMAELPEKFRTILVLRELEELSYGEIAEILQVSKGTVESRIFRARARLRERLERALKED